MHAEHSEPIAPPAGRMPPWAVAAAAAVHALVLVPALMVQTPAPPTVVVERPVAVRILSEDEFAALRSSSTGPEDPAEVLPAVAPSAADLEEPPLIRATSMLSGSVLADPRNREAREALPHLESSERMVQLCALEPMEQIHAWAEEIEPEWVSAYAFSEVIVQGDTVRADGGAFRSRGNWHELRFECALTRDHADVVAFAFAVGDAIPRETWDAHGLNAFDTE